MKNLTKTKLLSLLLGISLLSFFGSCMKDNEPNNVPVAGLTMVNAYLPVNSVYYAADNNRIQSIQYQQFNYVNLFPGNRRIRIFAENNSELVDTTYTFKDSTFYSSFVYGKQGDIRHLITQDKDLGKLDGKVGFRFFNLAPGQAKVNVYLDKKETPIYANRLYEGNEPSGYVNDHAKFKPQNSGKHKVIITNEAGETLVEREENFIANSYYSVVLIGDKSSNVRPLYIGIIRQYY